MQGNVTSDIIKTTSKVETTLKEEAVALAPDLNKLFSGHSGRVTFVPGS